MADNEQNRSEQPTPFKLQSARQKGSVARGMDLGFLAVITTFLCYSWVTIRPLAADLSTVSRNVLMIAPDLAQGSHGVLAIIALLFDSVARPLTIMLGTLFLIVLLLEIVQTGFVFSAEPLKPDFSRLNPAQGLRRIMSLRMLVEAAKNLLKLCIYGMISWLVVREAMRWQTALAVDYRNLPMLLERGAFRLLWAFVLGAAFFAVFDQAIVRRDFLKKMRMSRREVRREVREREGEPRLKQKRKQLHGEFVKTSASLRNLRGADVIVANPEHIAVALRYDPASMLAPMVVSSGMNQLAQRIKRLGLVYQIPIVENRALARALYRSGKLNREIPANFYPQVADIYNQLRRSSNRGDDHAG